MRVLRCQSNLTYTGVATFEGANKHPLTYNMTVIV